MRILTLNRSVRCWCVALVAVCMFAALAAPIALFSACTAIMPGDSFRGPLPILADSQRSVADQLRADVQALAGRIGERNMFHPEAYAAAEDFLAASLSHAGYQVRWQTFESRHESTTCAVSNLIAEITGTTASREVVVVGAHYDTFRGTPGADDNASGCAAVLALARQFAGARPERTLRFVLFANEEPPFFSTDQMGSLVYARDAKHRGDTVVAMLSLETLGYYASDEGTQQYPPLIGALYP